MLGIFTEFERSMIQERVKTGLKRYRAANPAKPWGRMPLEQANAELVAKIMELREVGTGMKVIAKRVGVSSLTVWRQCQVA